MDRVLVNSDRLEALIAEASASGGSERANYQLFVVRLCEALGLGAPDMAREQNSLNDYVFERRVDFKHPDGSRTHGWIDCYKRGSFILEAKQSAKRQVKRPDPGQMALLPEDAGQLKAGHAKRGSRGWDQVMLAARKQAEDYARALPVEHGYPPFLLVVDVGHVIEVFADFSGQGKNYAHFPDRRSYRIGLEDLREEAVQARLRAIWQDPLSLDPTRIAAEVTRDIAARLARIARRLEARHDPKDVAEFLMRCLFTMFAEDVGLLPEEGFHDLLERMRETPQHFVPALESLWQVMDEGGYAPHLNATLRRFNGALFRNRRALPLEKEEIDELWAAARKDWSDVEPAIFGTLLERALETRERAKLGAHYTPRAYVERLVIPTIIEPLRDDWELVQSDVQEKRERGEHAAALKAVKAFHHRLCTTRVLDPACGTGNFLYVALELMKRLEGEVLEALDDLGEEQARFAMEGETVSPRQFYGLELNPRAVPIADLVLWIGYLKWQLKTAGLQSISEPILHAYGTIRQQDAIIAYDQRELARDEKGRPLSRWDGITMKVHPVTGAEVPDPEARIEFYHYHTPRPAPWPEVEFIVGNPPFIGGKDMRAELGDGYAEACWEARPHLPGGADFVMHFWDEAAERLRRKSTKERQNPLRRFGFITTNSITQTFSRRVLERHLGAKEPLSLVFAVPDHPWLKAPDKAAVRIAMTVAEKGHQEGVLAEVASESELSSDTPSVSLKVRSGYIRSKLMLGADLSSTNLLLSNSRIAHMGAKLHGSGFILDSSVYNKEQSFYCSPLVHPFVNGKDLAQRARRVYVIDAFAYSEEQLRREHPEIYQRLLMMVKPEREQNRRQSYREKWWIWGEPRKEWRDAKQGLHSFIVTTRTARHRVFQIIPKNVVIESKVVGIASDSPELLTCLSSRAHVLFALETGGWLGIGNDPTYNHTDCFNPFPFPLAANPSLPENDPHYALQMRLRELGLHLDHLRKERLAEHSFLTMTGLYNALERLRELENGCDVPPLSEKEREVHQAGLVSLLKELHDEIDEAVLAAYGWEDLAPALVGKPGATLPSPHKSPEQEAAEEELLARLVALNQERAAEEKRGQVRWLRPDYQIPRLGARVPQPQAEELALPEIELPESESRQKWPADGLEQIRLVRDLLAKAPAPVPPDAILGTLAGRTTAKRRERVAEVLETLVATGIARHGEEEGQKGYFLPR